MVLKSVFRFIFPFISLSLAGQVPEKETRFPFFNLSGHSGFIIPHAKELKEISRSTPFGFQAEAGYTHTGEKEYNQIRSFFRLGLALQHIQFGNPRELGSSTALSPFLEPFIVTKNHWQMSFRFGLGAAFLSKIHDPENNPRNVFFSSSISFQTFLGISGRYQLHPNWKIGGSIFYNHLSNGGAKMPNKGMNFPTLALELDYLPKGEVFIKPKISETESKSILFHFETGLSIKNMPQDRKQGPAAIYNVMAMAEKKVSVVNGFSLGFEFTEDRYMKKDFEFWGLDKHHQTLGLMAGHSFHLGRIRLTQNYGLYLFNEDPNKRKAYQRYGIFYRLYRGLYVGGTLKAHRHVADIFDLRVGWSWQKKANRPVSSS